MVVLRFMAVVWGGVSNCPRMCGEGACATAAHTTTEAMVAVMAAAAHARSNRTWVAAARATARGAVAADAPPPPTRRCSCLSCVSELSPYVGGGGSRDGSSHDNGGDGGGDVAHWRVALHRCSAARARIECSASTHSTMSLYAPDQLLLSMRPVHQPRASGSRKSCSSLAAA